VRAAEPGGDVSVFLNADHTLILMAGDIDLAVVDDLEYAGRDAIDAGLPIVADVRRVTSMDSVGASFIVRMAAALGDRGLATTLLGPAPLVRELLHTIGAQDMLEWREGDRFTAT
jgi:anti-anti-sigma factor